MVLDLKNAISAIHVAELILLTECLVLVARVFLFVRFSSVKKISI